LGGVYIGLPVRFKPLLIHFINFDYYIVELHAGTEDQHLCLLENYFLTHFSLITLTTI